MTQERDELLALLRTLTPEDWARLTVCPGWSVKDVALHLLGDADFGWLSRGRDKDPTGLIPLSGDYRTFVAELNRKNERWVDAARALSPRLICELLEFCGPMVDAYLATIDMETTSSVSWAGRDPVPVWLDLARDFTERWVHQQQIRDAVARPGLTDENWLRPVLRTFLWALPHHYRTIPADAGTQLLVTITGSGGGQWTLTRCDIGWELDERVVVKAAAAIELTSDDAWRLLTGGLADVKRVRQSGDHRLSSWFLGARSIIV